MVRLAKKTVQKGDRRVLFRNWRSATTPKNASTARSAGIEKSLSIFKDI
jgi:hypothetical protein